MSFLALRTQVLQRRYGEAMTKHFTVHRGLGLTDANSVEEYYGFDCSQIERIHFHRQGFGGGTFFRLYDGRVIDTAARSHDPDPVLYDQTTH